MRVVRFVLRAFAFVQWLVACAIATLCVVLAGVTIVEMLKADGGISVAADFMLGWFIAESAVVPDCSFQSC